MQNKLDNILSSTNLIKYDKKNKLILSWNGGHGINIFNINCELMYFFTFMSKEDNATETEAIEAMNRRIKNNDYEDFRI